MSVEYRQEESKVTTRSRTLTVMLACPLGVALPWTMGRDGESISKDGEASRASRGRGKSRAMSSAIYVACKQANEGEQHILNIDGTVPHPVLQSLSQGGLPTIPEWKQSEDRAQSQHADCRQYKYLLGTDRLRVPRPQHVESELRPHCFVHSLLLSLRLQHPHKYVPNQKKRTMLSRSVVDEPRVWALGGYWPQTYRRQVLQLQCNRAIKTRWAKVMPSAHAGHMFYMTEWVRRAVLKRDGKMLCDSSTGPAVYKFRFCVWGITDCIFDNVVHVSRPVMGQQTLPCSHAPTSQHGQMCVREGPTSVTVLVRSLSRQPFSR